ncbi:Uncharacterised protein [Chlamydia trachomatis]|nr:Uncharacterised protein [Chlamydia trachomatis]
MLDKDLVNDLKRFAVDPTIIDKLDNHVPLNDLDSLKLIQQLYNVGYQAHKNRVEFSNPFGISGRSCPGKGRTDIVLRVAEENKL